MGTPVISNWSRSPQICRGAADLQAAPRLHAGSPPASCVEQASPARRPELLNSGTRRVERSYNGTFLLEKRTRLILALLAAFGGRPGDVFHSGTMLHLLLLVLLSV